MTNDDNATIAARRADLREMLRYGDDHYEGIDKDDALAELLDLLDKQDAEPTPVGFDNLDDFMGAMLSIFPEAVVEVDNEGQLVVYTNLIERPDGSIVSMGDI